MCWSRAFYLPARSLLRLMACQMGLAVFFSESVDHAGSDDRASDLLPARGS